MPVGPQEAQLLAMLADASDAPTELEPRSARAGYRALAAVLAPGPNVNVVDKTIPGPGGELPIRVYTPTGEGPFGALVYFHGGGWTIGDLDTHDHPCRTLCHDAEVVVVSVDYRLAPEHPYPAAVDDAWAAVRWVGENGADLGIDTGRIAVGGDSAGGNLAAVAAIKARDEGGPNLAFQLLVYPGVDARSDAVTRYASRRQNAEGYFLTSTYLAFFARCYLPDIERGDDWQASPLLAADHAGLPPALVITAEFDPLRDEGAAYAKTLAEAGTPVTYTCYPETIHAMFQLAPLLDAGRDALAEAASAIRAHLGVSR